MFFFSIIYFFNENLPDKPNGSRLYVFGGVHSRYTGIAPTVAVLVLYFQIKKKYSETSTMLCIPVLSSLYILKFPLSKIFYFPPPPRLKRTYSVCSFNKKNLLIINFHVKQKAKGEEFESVSCNGDYQLQSLVEVRP